MKSHLLAILLVFFLFAGCSQEATSQVAKPEAPEPVLEEPSPSIPKEVGPAHLFSYPITGVSISPKSPSPDDFAGFFEKATEAGNLVMWAGDWADLSAPQGAPGVITELAETYDYVPLVEVTYYTQGENAFVRPLTPETRAGYISSAADFAEKYEPEYLGFGIEINIMYEKSPEDFEEFVSLYSDVYDAVKEKSPRTKVFTVFQLEHMKGLDGGLFGGENNPENATWFLIDKFPKSDAVAFSTYPCFVYKDPSEIPEEYYTEIREHTSKPVLFTESGWFREGPVGWESNAEEQAEFINRFFVLTNEVEPEILVWSFLYDQEVQYPFDSMGLLAADEETSPAYRAWKNG